MPIAAPVIEVSDADLEDLRARLRATRWPEPWPVDSWEAGTDAAELRRLVTLWATDYTWRTHEAAVNALPSHFADIDGTPVHYLRYDAEHPDALPIVLTHGWPSTVLELTTLAERLAAPSRHGGDARDAFTVIVPSLPGFAFSPSGPPSPVPSRPTSSGTGSCVATSASTATRPTAEISAPASPHGSPKRTPSPSWASTCSPPRPRPTTTRPR